MTAIICVRLEVSDLFVLEQSTVQSHFDSRKGIVTTEMSVDLSPKSSLSLKLKLKFMTNN